MQPFWQVNSVTYPKSTQNNVPWKPVIVICNSYPTRIHYDTRQHIPYHQICNKSNNICTEWPCFRHCNKQKYNNKMCKTLMSCCWYVMLNNVEFPNVSVNPRVLGIRSVTNLASKVHDLIVESCDVWTFFTHITALILKSFVYCVKKSKWYFLHAGNYHCLCNVVNKLQAL